MIDYCLDLNLNTPPLIPNISLSDLQDRGAYWTLVDLKYINPDLKELFNSLGLVLPIAAIFAAKQNEPNLKHSDGKQMGDAIKINWSSNTAHDMIWYKLKNSAPNEEFRMREDPALQSRPFILYADDEVTEVFRCPVGHPSIVQVGVPHNVLNYEGTRLCLSITPYDKQGKVIPMWRAKQIFARYL